jgi:hypothetical protein
MSWVQRPAFAAGIWLSQPFRYHLCLSGRAGLPLAPETILAKVPMKAQAPAITQAALVATAGRKADKVQRKLQQAEAELHTANTILVKAVPTNNRKAIDSAVEQNVAAEEKVHDAAEELQVVKELLADADAEAIILGTPEPHSKGQSGDGVKSLMPHLARRRSRAPE